MDAVKREMAGYWSKRVEGFSALRQREYDSEKRGLWRRELERYLPAGRRLDILDIGTGTGFFALLLAEQGHRVTGIDLTPGMVAEAKRLAGALGASAEFLVMDAELPAFAPRSFDAIVTRKLTWTLPHIDRAYRRWHRLLKPGGVLVNFDGDYCREDPAPSLPPCHAHKTVGAELMGEYERMKAALRPMQRPRPQWDVELLKRAGFRDIAVDTGVWRRIYGAIDEFYDPTPVFTIAATA